MENLSNYVPIEKLNIVAIGFDMFLPAISGAEPWTGSYRDLVLPFLSLSPNDADGSKPNEPVSIAASSDNISPNKLSAKITSNCFGFLNNCIAQLSANI